MARYVANNAIPQCRLGAEQDFGPLGHWVSWKLASFWHRSDLRDLNLKASYCISPKMFEYFTELTTHLKLTLYSSATSVLAH